MFQGCGTLLDYYSVSNYSNAGTNVDNDVNKIEYDAVVGFNYNFSNSLSYNTNCGVGNIDLSININIEDKADINPSYQVNCKINSKCFSFAPLFRSELVKRSCLQFLYFYL